VKYLFVNDGESALIRFIGDDEMIQTKIHEYKELTPDGERWRKAYCKENLLGTPCKWEAAGNVPKNVYVFLVYVYNILHKEQNRRLATDTNAVKWEAVKQGPQTFYKEDVEDIRVLRVKYGKNSYLKNAVLQMVGEYGTLCDRDYKFVRTGGGKETVYSFVPRDPSKTSAKVIEAKRSAPSLEEVLTGKKSGNGKAEPVVAEEEQEDENAPTKGAEAKSTRGRKSKEDKSAKDVGDLF
jgi:hypothetical protein